MRKLIGGIVILMLFAALPAQAGLKEERRAYILFYARAVQSNMTVLSQPSSLLYLLCRFCDQVYLIHQPVNKSDFLYFMES